VVGSVKFWRTHEQQQQQRACVSEIRWCGGCWVAGCGIVPHPHPALRVCVVVCLLREGGTPAIPTGVCCRVFITGGIYAGYSNRCVLSCVYYGREVRRLFQQVCVVVCLLREGGTPAIPTGVCCRVFITGGRHAGYSNRCVLSCVYYGREVRRLFQQVCVVVCLLFCRSRRT
jgi:hypothetical protein